MEIKDFISNTIEQVSEGIRDAQSKCRTYGTVVNPMIGDGSQGDYYIPFRPDEKWQVQTLDMDIAVSVTETSGNEKGGKIGISAIGAGMNIQKGASMASESRIRFAIPICWPTTGR